MGNLFRKKSLESVAYGSKSEESGQALEKTLGYRDIVSLGLAAVIGAGIFGTIGSASAHAGPAVIFLFIFASITCGFCAMAYAEFASMIRVSGSAYTYCYVSFGEIVAWIIGWSLILEYAVSNIAVAISWSDYFSALLANLNIPALGIHGITFAEWIQIDYNSAKDGFMEMERLLRSGMSIDKLPDYMKAAHTAWMEAPQFMGLRIIFDLPAIIMVILITMLVYRGIKESKTAANWMVVFKVAVLLIIIFVGAFFIDVKNWSDFMPNGFRGVMSGIGAVFFAYIGFDSISTVTEECKNPQRDMPRGMITCLILCTLLYIAVALVATGIVNYQELAVGDPLAYVFSKMNLDFFSSFVAVSGLVALTSSFLVYQIGQPRIWMNMGRDGLLPRAFAKIHPKYKTPYFATIVTGFVVIIPSFFMNLNLVVDLCSLGTLFAFALVSAGVLVLHGKPEFAKRATFRSPFVNSKYVFLPLLIAVALALWINDKQECVSFLTNAPQLKSAKELLSSVEHNNLDALKDEVTKMEEFKHQTEHIDLEENLSSLSQSEYISVLQRSGISEDQMYNQGWGLFFRNIPHWLFILLCLGVAVLTFIKKLSFIPLMGVVSPVYLISELGVDNWIAFVIWTSCGLIIYFFFSRKHSKLRLATE